MPRSTRSPALCLILLCGSSAQLLASDPPPEPEAFTSLVKKYCAKCHSGTKPKAQLDLTAKPTPEAIGKDRERWDRILDVLELRQMPPKGKPRPTEREYDRALGWIEKQLDDIDCANGLRPGRVTLRRLNRSEFNNTIRDLLKVDFRPGDSFPADDVGEGFDNNADVLTISPILMEKYLDAAELILSKAIAVAEPAGEKIPESHRAAISCGHPPGDHNADCPKRILSSFTERTYRRPVQENELERLLAIYTMVRKQSVSLESAMRVALQAVLVSPNFLFRAEANPAEHDAGEPRPLNDFELASRLSYFLWSSMPDQRLFDLAKKGKLVDPAVLKAEARRMLQDDKALALVDNFAAQWLNLRNLEQANPDATLFPGFSSELRSDMAEETERFFATIMSEDRSILEFLDSDFTFLNQRLAEHYGIANVTGDQFRRVRLDSQERGGLLTQASILTITSNPTRTSPVKRGKWILENMLGTPPPPPPAGVEELAEDEQAQLSGSLRQRMEQHRSKPICASCHERMDPLGFGFENFDAIGRWRDQDGKFPIDPSGTLPGGDTFQGPADLKNFLKSSRREQFCRCLAEKMLTFALGRGLEYFDKCAVDEILGRLRKAEYRFSALIIGVVESTPFRMRGSGVEE